MRLVVDLDHYLRVVQQVLVQARVSVWIGTANVKEMMIEAPIGTTARARGRYISVLSRLDELAARGVEMRLLHATLPSGPFRQELRRFPRLARGGLAMRRCPRVHMKVIAVDGTMLYLGSANFTGAGLGAKGEGKRNFEVGVLTEDDVLLDAVQGRYERIWSGSECGACKQRSICPKPLDRM